MYLKKLFNADATEGGGGTEEVTVGKRGSVSELFGIGDEGDAGGADDTDASDNGEGDGGDDAGAGAEGAAADSSANNDASDQGNPDDDKDKQQQQQQNAELQFDEVLKNKDLTEVLKAKGVPDLFIEMLNAHNGGQDFMEFLQVKTKDWDKVPDEQLMRDQLRSEYPELSEAAFEKLYQQEVIDKYKIGDDHFAEDKELGLAKLKKDAAKIRAERKKEQGEFKAPEPMKPQEGQPDAEADEKAQADYEAYVESIQNDAVTKDVIQNKRVVLGDGDEALNFEFNPVDALEAAKDTNKLFARFWKGEGENKKLDLNLWYKVNALLQDPSGYDKALINKGKTLANLEMIEEGENPSGRSQGGAPRGSQKTVTVTRKGSLGDLM